MADRESDLETEKLEFELDALFDRYRSDVSTLQSKGYCSEFCKLVEEHAGRWQVPLPQLKLLRAALYRFTRATSAFPDDCQHICYVLSSLALSFFELLLFFRKEEFRDNPLKDILHSFQNCHSSLLRHKNVYLQQVRRSINSGGPWENPVLQAILREAALPRTDVEEYLSSEAPLFLELRVRYLQACERVPEALALAKSCLEHPTLGGYLYFHQAYLTCVYKASLHEHLLKEMADIDGRDAVEIICNTESVVKDELLLSLCKAFLTQQLQNGDMYYIWDLVFLWSRLHLRAHPSKRDFLAECQQLMASTTNVRAIFPFIKVVTEEMGSEGIQFCVELCAQALRCDVPADPQTRSLVCKTIAFLLPRDLDVCRAAALLVLRLERSLEAYRTVCLLYRHPDQDQHPHRSAIRTNVRFHILQVLKEGLGFDPEFWNLLTLRTHCLELMSDKAMKAALSEMQEEEDEEEEEEEEEKEEEEEEEEMVEELIPNDQSMHEACGPPTDTPQLHPDPPPVSHSPAKEEKGEGGDRDGGEAPPEPIEDKQGKRRWWVRRKRRRRGRRRHDSDDADSGDDPEFKYAIKRTDGMSKYSLRRHREESLKQPVDRQREYLARLAKNTIRKRRGRKPRWLLLEMSRQAENTAPEGARDRGQGQGRGRRGRRHALRTMSTTELSYPENEVLLEEEEEEDDGGESSVTGDGVERTAGCEESRAEEAPARMDTRENGREDGDDGVDPGSVRSTLPQADFAVQPPPPLSEELRPPAVSAELELDGPAMTFKEDPLQLFHSYSEQKPPLEDESTSQGEVMKPWKVRALRARRYAPLQYHCDSCHKDFKGGNVLRHSLAHLKRRRPRCVFCGTCFKKYNLAKQHVLQHIEELLEKACARQEPRSAEPGTEPQPLPPPPPPSINGTVEPLDYEAPASKTEPEVEIPKPKTEIAKPKSEITKPKSEITKPKSEITKPKSEITKPKSEITKPKSEITKPKSEITKPKSEITKPKPEITKQARIIQNLRSLLKKTNNHNKKLVKPSDPEQKLVDFRDEQVTVKDKLVILRDAPSPAKENEASENGVRKEYHLCPAEGCHKIFVKIGPSLLKHALGFHMGDRAVLERTFLWGKGRCIYCQRRMLNAQHYTDHMKVHDAPLRQTCVHQRCSLRFKTSTELKEHTETHQPFLPQCPFPGCELLFNTLAGLQDHEWRHYTQPQPSDKEGAAPVGPAPVPVNPEAPWKQRVKIEELWQQGGKSPRREPAAGPRRAEGARAEGARTLESDADAPQASDGSTGLAPDVASDGLPGDSGQTPVNGHDEPATVQAPPAGDTPASTPASTTASPTSPPASPPARSPPEPQSAPADGKSPEDGEPQRMDVKEMGEQVTLPEDTSTFEEPVILEEPVIPTRKTFKPFKPEDAYVPYVKAPFLRPPPSTYLDESALSMRKRRVSPGAPPASSSYGGKSRPPSVKQKPAPQRRRCPNCLASFGGAEQLQKHQALNTCSSLFSLDSDDDS